MATRGTRGRGSGLRLSLRHLPTAADPRKNPENKVQCPVQTYRKTTDPISSVEVSAALVQWEVPVVGECWGCKAAGNWRQTSREAGRRERSVQTGAGARHTGSVSDVMLIGAEQGWATASSHPLSVWSSTSIHTRDHTQIIARSLSLVTPPLPPQGRTKPPASTLPEARSNPGKLQRCWIIIFLHNH